MKKAKVVFLGNTSERTVCIRIVDEDGAETHLELTTAQLQMLLQQASSIIWNDYKLVLR